MKIKISLELSGYIHRFLPPLPVPVGNNTPRPVGIPVGIDMSEVIKGNSLIIPLFFSLKG